MAYRLGIDTGGTYTDAVLFEAETRQQTDGNKRSDTFIDAGVVKANKSLTTRHNLFEGIAASAAPVLKDTDPNAVELVSVSTTLATNAIVEGLRPPVALVLIGFDEKALDRGNLREALQDDEVIFLKGGHKADGNQAQELDLSPLKSGFNRQIESVAVVGKFAVRNRSHELAVARFISDTLQLPVTCSYELSQKLNGPLRAVTTLFNARLLPHLADLIHSTRDFLNDHKITAPLMIVQGDGSLVAADDAVERPIETVLSGPAASLVGAWHLVRKHKGKEGTIERICVSDMGGTTTDIGFLDKGRPRLAEDGASVGGFRTHVRAVDMQTWGLGGDSEIGIASAKLTVGPRRAEPLCVAADRFPSIIKDLQAQLDDLRPDLGNARFLRRFRDMPAEDLNKHERELWDAMADGPVPLRDFERSYAGAGAVQSLIKRGRSLMIAFTPTDAAHVLGMQDTNSKQAALLGADLMRVPKDFEAWVGFDSAEALAKAVVERTHQEVARVHLASSLQADGIKPSELGPKLTETMICGKEASTLKLRPMLDLPLIGVGAPAKLYYQTAIQRLGGDFQDLPNADVCNAVGAVAGGIVRNVSVLITSPAEGIYRLHLPEGSRDVRDDESAARELAETEARKLAVSAAQSAGATHIEVDVVWTDKVIDMGGAQTFLEARVAVEASGPPKTKTETKAAA